MKPDEIIYKAETELLGSFVHFPDTYLINCDTVHSTYFNFEDTADLLESIEGMTHKNVPIDYYILKNFLSQREKDSTIALLEQLPKQQLTKERISYLYKLICDEYLRLYLHHVSSNIAQITSKPAASIDAIDTTLGVMQDVMLKAKAKSKSIVKRIDSLLTEVLANIKTGIGNMDAVFFNSKLLNTYLCGMRPEELILVSARPGIGRNGFILSQVLHVLTELKKPVLYISLEESSKKLSEMLLSMLANVPLIRMHSTDLTEEETSKLITAAEVLKTLPLHIVQENDLNVYQLNELCKHYTTEHGVKLIAVDCLHLLKSGAYSNYRDQEVTSVVQKLKLICKQYHVPLFAGAYISRSAEKRSLSSFPLLSDLRDSGSLEDLADKVLILNRLEFYGITEYENGESTNCIMEIHIAKNNYGPLNQVKMKFDQYNLNVTEVESDSKHTEYNGDNFVIPSSRYNDLE